MGPLRRLLRRVRARVLRPVDAELQELKRRIGTLEELLSKHEKVMSDGPDCLATRLDNLELLATEHSDAAVGGLRGAVFPSPAVSIIMPTWNRARVIGDAVRSAQDQRFADWELIVVDDGSTDDTAAAVAALAASDTRIRYVHQAHAGQSTARNRALRLAAGTLVAYLDSDNVWYREFLATAVTAFAANTGISCAYGAMISEPPHIYQRVLFRPFDREKLLAGNYIGMSTFIHRRNLVDRYGGFDETLATLEDWDLILRYTVDAPALRLPVLAVRKRVVDSINVSNSRPAADDFARIKAKWRAG